MPFFGLFVVLVVSCLACVCFVVRLSCWSRVFSSSVTGRRVVVVLWFVCLCRLFGGEIFLRVVLVFVFLCVGVSDDVGLFCCRCMVLCLVCRW